MKKRAIVDAALAVQFFHVVTYGAWDIVDSSSEVRVSPRFSDLLNALDGYSSVLASGELWSVLGSLEGDLEAYRAIHALIRGVVRHQSGLWMSRFVKETTAWQLMHGTGDLGELIYVAYCHRVEKLVSALQHLTRSGQESPEHQRLLGVSSASAEEVNSVCSAVWSGRRSAMHQAVTDEELARFDAFVAEISDRFVEEWRKVHQSSTEIVQHSLALLGQ